MKITWFGQACFELVTANGTVIICDPYHPNVGYEAHPRSADIVTISHEHFDHCYTGWIEGSPDVFRGEGRKEKLGLAFTGLSSFHDEVQGAKRGSNTVFVIEVDGLRLCHLGDLGEEPGEDLLNGIGKPDVLLIPVGGYYTIDGEQASAIAARIGARLTIPMHFATGAKETPISPVDKFASLTGAASHGGCSIEVDKNYSGPAFVVLDYLRE